MHSEAGVPLRTFHLGPDVTAGAWVKSPACQTMIAENGGDAGKLPPRVIKRVHARLAAQDLCPGGWGDARGHTQNANIPTTPPLVQTTNSCAPHNAANTKPHDHHKT